MIPGPDPTTDAGVERVLVVMAHPDDIEHLAAGTVAQWVAAGVGVTYCVVTDGAAGGADPDAPRPEVAAVREAEQRAAAAVVGVGDVRFLSHPDGGLRCGPGLERELVRTIRQVRPQRVLTQSPEINWDFLPDAHADHRACGQGVVEALYPHARNPRAHRDLLDAGLEPWTVSQLWMVGSPSPNHFVDVTSTFEVKLAALSAHASQVEDPAALRGWLRARLERQARRGGLPPGRLAEEFRVVATTW